MSVPEFEAVRHLLTISEDRVAAARAALVEGRTLRSNGDQYNWTRQAVNDAVGVVWCTFENYREAQRAEINATIKALPSDWERVTLFAPSHLITKFREEIALLLSQSLNNAYTVRTSRKGTEKP